MHCCEWRARCLSFVSRGLHDHKHYRLVSDFCITVRAVGHHWRRVINAAAMLAGGAVWATRANIDTPQVFKRILETAGTTTFK